MMAFMHRVDAVGIFSRIIELGYVVRRSYSVRGLLFLVNIDTNHKLIRSLNSGQKEVSLLNCSGVWDIYKSWMRVRDLRSFKIQALTGRVLYCKRNPAAQLWFLRLNALEGLQRTINPLEHFESNCMYRSRS
ncbi:unnamed protein product [Oreochromis niloticus]|nr:unnamed protein product [Mustela putorius furo]